MSNLDSISKDVVSAASNIFRNHPYETLFVVGALCLSAICKDKIQSISQRVLGKDSIVTRNIKSLSGREDCPTQTQRYITAGTFSSKLANNKPFPDWIDFSAFPNYEINGTPLLHNLFEKEGLGMTGLEEFQEIVSQIQGKNSDIAAKMINLTDRKTGDTLLHVVAKAIKKNTRQDKTTISKNTEGFLDALAPSSANAQDLKKLYLILTKMKGVKIIKNHKGNIPKFYLQKSKKN